jgi:hypothetical protein
MLYVGQVEIKETVAHKVKVMQRHGKTLQFAFSHKDNVSEIEMEDIVLKIPGPISSRTDAHTTSLKYCRVNFLRKELCTQKNSVFLWTLS